MGQPWRVHDDFDTILTVGSLPAEPSPLPVLHVDLGEDHPTRPGLVTIPVRLDDDVITDTNVRIGYLHRGAEKLFEVRDYRQIPMLASRHDWQAPFVGEVGSALVTERALGITPPERVTWLRTLLVEFTRMSSHLAFLSWTAHAAEDGGLASAIHDSLSSARLLWQSLSGNRLHPMITRLGGIGADADAAWCERLDGWLDDTTDLGGRIRAVLDSPRLRELCTGVAVLGPDEVDRFGLSGPVARAAGVPMDLRRTPGHLAHDRLRLPGIEAPTDGDARSRLHHLAAELGQSADLCRQVCDLLPGIGGPLETRLPTVVRAPRGTFWSELEAPWGRAGYLLVSRGERTPWRLALRTPTFADVQALEAVLPGTRLAQVPAAIASLGWTLGDLDK